MGDLLRDVNVVAAKIIGLARAISQRDTTRPGKGVQSTGEVFIDVAADDYFRRPPWASMRRPRPALAATTRRWRRSKSETMTRDQIVAELEKSFAFARRQLTTRRDAKLDAPLEGSGRR